MRSLYWVFSLTVLALVSEGTVVFKKEANSGDIEDIILDLNPEVVLNSDTPENTLVGTIIVLTFSRKAYKLLQISDNNPYFHLRSEQLFLKASGDKLLKDVNSIMLSINATDFSDPPGVLNVNILFIGELKTKFLNILNSRRNLYVFPWSTTKKTLYYK
jgi:hypothetical protein